MNCLALLLILSGINISATVAGYPNETLGVNETYSGETFGYDTMEVVLGAGGGMPMQWYIDTGLCIPGVPFKEPDNTEDSPVVVLKAVPIDLPSDLHISHISIKLTITKPLLIGNGLAGSFILEVPIENQISLVGSYPVSVDFSYKSLFRTDNSILGY